MAKTTYSSEPMGKLMIIPRKSFSKRRNTISVCLQSQNLVEPYYCFCDSVDSGLVSCKYRYLPFHVSNYFHKKLKDI